jgi:hypothetical protein
LLILNLVYLMLMCSINGRQNRIYCANGCFRMENSLDWYPTDSKNHF